MLKWVKRRMSMKNLNSGLTSAFSKIKEDLYFQKKALNELYDNHHNLKNNTHLNNKRLIEWIQHFEKTTNKLEKDFSGFEEQIKKRFDLLTEKSLDLFKEAYSKNIKDVDTIKKEILEEVRKSLSPSHIEKSKEVKKIIIEKPFLDTPFDMLSNPEKWLVGVLFNAENPLSYEQIATKTGKTINTVRVYMNQLKIKGFVDDSSLPNGVKLFSLRHKAKVKKLYNL